jgi:hypothetical protein
MKPQLSRLELLKEYELAPEATLFSQETVAAIRDCSLATIERDRWAGTGIPFVKTGRLVRYRKSDIRAWLEKHIAVQSTTQADQQTNKGLLEKAKESTQEKNNNKEAA